MVQNMLTDGDIRTGGKIANKAEFAGERAVKSAVSVFYLKITETKEK